MEVLFIVIIIIVYIIQGVFWGNITNKVIEDKGYYDNWFWWGFFFNWIALLVAFSKPVKIKDTSYDDGMLLEKWNDGNKHNNGRWECAFCHLVNESIVSTCACGKDREESEQYAKSQNTGVKEEDIILLLREYKELMDDGIITQAEFNAKKKELLRNQG